MCGIVEIGGDEGDDLSQDFFSGFGVGGDVRKNGIGSHGFFLDFPAIVVGDHGDGCDGDFCFACEADLAEVGHPDDIESEVAVGIGLGSGGESGASHI